MPVALDDLPTELYDTILRQINPADRQATALALCLALPRSPVPTIHLYRYVHVRQRSQVSKLWRRLTTNAGQKNLREPHWIQSFELQGWDTDADVVINVVELLSQLKHLYLNIGTTFAPEHLSDMFRKPRRTLRTLSLRFRPYVEKATYYQFLKGQYSDILIEHMTDWPSNPSLTHLSLLQDPLPETSFNPSTSFAQPIVFFSLDIFRPFSTSALARYITHLRIRVPSRPVIAQLLEPGAFPSLRVLDIGTTAWGNPATERALSLLLARHPRLEHLLLDECSLSREGWRDLGRACALAGQGRARVREKSVNAWIEANNARIAATGSGGGMGTGPNGSVNGAEAAAAPRRARHGRRGLAVAAFSIRTPTNSDTSTAQNPSPQTLMNTTESFLPLGIQKKVRILPPLPNLLTFSTSFTPPPSDNAKASEWRREFLAGWIGGIEVLKAARARMRSSASSTIGNGIRLMRFADPLPDPSTEEGSTTRRERDESYDNLVDVHPYGEKYEAIWEEKGTIPLICFGVVRVPGVKYRSNVRPRASSVIEELHAPPLPEVGEAPAGGLDNEDARSEGDAQDGEDQTVEVNTSSKPDAQLRDNGHAIGCGHELHEKTWDIYERALWDLST